MTAGDNTLHEASSVEHLTQTVIDSATRELSDRLLLEGISLADIARAVRVSEQWWQTYVNQKYAKVRSPTPIFWQRLRQSIKPTHSVEQSSTSVGKETGKTSYVVRASVAKQNASTIP